MSAFDEFIEGTFGCLFALILGSFFLLMAYGVAVIVFKYAFGIELPNPFDWLPPEWRDFIDNSV